MHHRYIPDFKITTRSGNVIYIEVKGYFRGADRVKLAAVKKMNPDKDIRILFQADNKVSKFGKMRYTDWANKYNFPAAVGTIPKDWLV